MSLFVVRYTYEPTLTDRRMEIRPQHRDWLTGLLNQGVNRASGPLADDSGGLLVFEAPDRESIHELLLSDPYKEAEVIAATEVLEWVVVMGSVGATPDSSRPSAT